MVDNAQRIGDFIIHDASGDGVFQIHNPEDKIYEADSGILLTGSQALSRSDEFVKSLLEQNIYFDVSNTQSVATAFVPGYVQTRAQTTTPNRLRTWGPLAIVGVAVWIGFDWWRKEEQAPEVDPSTRFFIIASEDGDPDPDDVATEPDDVPAVADDDSIPPRHDDDFEPDLEALDGMGDDDVIALALQLKGLARDVGAPDEAASKTDREFWNKVKMRLLRIDWAEMDDDKFVELLFVIRRGDMDGDYLDLAHLYATRMRDEILRRFFGDGNALEIPRLWWLGPERLVELTIATQMLWGHFMLQDDHRLFLLQTEINDEQSIPGP